jgi:hypothetical protein
MPLLQGQTAAPRGEIIGDQIYVNCQYRVAASFPHDPKIRDITYRDGKISAPARQFTYESGKDLYSVTVVYFASGPEVDPQLIAHAADAFGKRGTVRYDASVFYDEPGIPGRQLNIALSDGRTLHGSVYMAKNRLYISEVSATPGDIPAFLFEQSISLLDENGTDLDTNAVGVATNAVGTSAGPPSRQYDCTRINRPK